MLKSFNKLETERGYVKVSFLMRSYFTYNIVLGRSLVLIH
jgi:hypothetical protein